MPRTAPLDIKIADAGEYLCRIGLEGYRLVLHLATGGRHGPRTLTFDVAPLRAIADRDTAEGTEAIRRLEQELLAAGVDPGHVDDILIFTLDSTWAE